MKIAKKAFHTLKDPGASSVVRILRMKTLSYNYQSCFGPFHQTAFLRLYMPERLPQGAMFKKLLGPMNQIN